MILSIIGSALFIICSIAWIYAAVNHQDKMTEAWQKDFIYRWGKEEVRWK